jgi:hypothetical protein
MFKYLKKRVAREAAMLYVTEHWLVQLLATENIMYRVSLAIMAFFACCGVSWAQLPSPLHDYELNNSLADSLGGPSLVNNGATLGATGLTFAANQGPSLSSWLGGSATSGNYSIEMYFSLDTTISFRKLIDYSNRVSDFGLYNINTLFSYMLCQQVLVEPSQTIR